MDLNRKEIEDEKCAIYQLAIRQLDRDPGFVAHCWRVGVRISRACLYDEVEKPEVMASIFRSEVVQDGVGSGFRGANFRLHFMHWLFRVGQSGLG